MIQQLETYPMLTLGDKGFPVVDLQKMLGIAETADFDKRTLDAVIDFQIWHGLLADGVVTNEVWAKLQSRKA